MVWAPDSPDLWAPDSATPIRWVPDSGGHLTVGQGVDLFLAAKAAEGAAAKTLERGLSPTTAQEARWKRLVEHNRHDCAGMRRVCIRATTEGGGA